MASSYYTEYLKSPEWQEKRIQRITIDSGRCCMCGKELGNALEVHHFGYKSLANEDPWVDLASMCPECHLNTHVLMNRLTAPHQRGWASRLPFGVRISLRERGLM
ncbi:MAG: HNH endonuclease [Eubacterium sp.]|nr:HNH endonuclease [Eubacterium sp.]